MLRHLVSVGGMTLLSRITGFARDIVLSGVLGAGAAADAFVVAFRLPNHFRAIFGEGAFNAAYVPTYSRLLEKDGAEPAQRFSSQIFTLLLISQLILLALAWIFTPLLVRLLAPGFTADPARFELTVALTRITFPYLLCITLVTLHSGTLNANRRFAAAAFAPVLLNLSMMAALAVAFLFPTAGHAAAFGVLLAGVLELALVSGAAKRIGALATLARPRFGADVKHFFKVIIPAVIGSAGVQIAIFADTIISSFLPAGGPSSIYYADRIYQLPIGVIGIAAGTVLLPEMSRRFAAGEDAKAFLAQNHAMALTIMLSAPFFIAFLTIPDAIMRGIFRHGAFSDADALASARVLAAYGLGLMAVVLIRSAVASFQSRGDTFTPMAISLTAVAINVAIKFALYEKLGAVALALATAIGAWVNLLLLAGFAMKRGVMKPDATFWKILAACTATSVVVGFFVHVYRIRIHYIAEKFGELSRYAELAGLSIFGVGLYVILLVGLLFALRVPFTVLRRGSRTGS